MVIPIRLERERRIIDVKNLKVFIIALFLTVSLIMMANIAEVKSEPGEPGLDTVLNTLGDTYFGTRYRSLPDPPQQTWIDGIWDVTLYAEFAGGAGNNVLSWYPAGTNDFHEIFSGPEGGSGYVNPPLTKRITTTAEFGLSLSHPNARFYTETSRNARDAVRVYRYQYTYTARLRALICWEDSGIIDKDYQDMVITLVWVPSIATVQTADWREWGMDQFKEGESVYVQGWGYPLANHDFDLYIVKRRTWTAEMPFDDPNDPWDLIVKTSVRTDGSGNIIFKRVWSNALEGQYDLAVDVNDDGNYDERTPDPIPSPFTVWKEHDFPEPPIQILMPMAITLFLVYTVMSKKRKKTATNPAIKP